MLQNAYVLAKIGAHTAENEQHFAENLPKIGNYPTGPGFRFEGRAAVDGRRVRVHGPRELPRPLREGLVVDPGLGSQRGFGAGPIPNSGNLFSNFRISRY